MLVNELLIENENSAVVVGAQRELSRSAKQFVADCAEKGPISPERLGCCHGEDHARAMIANSINSAFGRISLRGVARVRHSARTATTGSKQCAIGHSSSTCGQRGSKNT